MTNTRKVDSYEGSSDTYENRMLREKQQSRNEALWRLGKKEEPWSLSWTLLCVAVVVLIAMLAFRFILPHGDLHGLVEFVKAMF